MARIQGPPFSAAGLFFPALLVAVVVCAAVWASAWASATEVGRMRKPSHLHRDTLHNTLLGI